MAAEAAAAMKRSAIPASALALLIASQLGLPALAGDPCSAPWVMQRRSAARDDDRRFSPVRGGAFRDKSWLLEAAGETVPTHKTFFMPRTPAAERP